jgi:hypothetical protein
MIDTDKKVRSKNLTNVLVMTIFLFLRQNEKGYTPVVLQQSVTHQNLMTTLAEI